MDFTVGREVEGTASAKVLDLEHAWHIQGTGKCDERRMKEGRRSGIKRQGMDTGPYKIF